MTDMEALPDGIWKKLFPRALTLIDEIAKHGGVSEPFFTFGGGTVLMLRYRHRYNKDATKKTRSPLLVLARLASQNEKSP